MKTKQKAKILYYSPLWLIANAIRYSHNNHNKSDTDNILQLHGYDLTEEPDFDDIGIKDFDLIKRVGFKLKHESVLEFVDVIYHIECSRAVLQELARHRHISLTVKSTRYTLKELLNEKFLVNWEKQNYSDNFEKYIVLTGDWNIDRYNISMLISLIKNLKEKKSNDIVKYMLPEAFKTQMQFKCNFRELLHILRLRTAKDALWEFRQVAYEMFKELPDVYQELVLSDEQIAKQIEQCKKDFEIDS